MIGALPAEVPKEVGKEFRATGVKRLSSHSRGRSAPREPNDKHERATDCTVWGLRGFLLEFGSEEDLAHALERDGAWPNWPQTPHAKKVNKQSSDAPQAAKALTRGATC